MVLVGFSKTEWRTPPRTDWPGSVLPNYHGAPRVPGACAVRAAFAAVCSEYDNVTVKPRAEPIRRVAAVNGGCRAMQLYPLARLSESSEPTPTLVGRKGVWFEGTSRVSEMLQQFVGQWKQIPCKKKKRRMSSSRPRESEIVTELKMGHQ